MKKVLLTASLAFFTLAMQAQKTASADPHAGHNHGTPAATTATAEKAPETLKIEEVHDFGKIPQGKPVTYDFVATNTGNTAMKINNVQASCGCTTPEWDKDNMVEPGATTKIKIGYNAQAEGPFNKSITITYNDNVTKVLNIKGEVWKTPAASAPENTGASEIKN